MRQQLVDTAGRMGRNTFQDVLEVRVGLMPVDARRVKQAHDGGGSLTRSQTACEQPVRPVERQFRFIVPMSGKKLRSSTVGTRCPADACAACTASAAQPVSSST